LTRTFSIGLDVGRGREKVALVRLRLSKALLGARLDPRAPARALLGPRPRDRRRPGGLSSASVRVYRARRVAQQVKALARDRLRAVAVDGKTCRGARRAGGTRVHLLGVAEHGGRLLDHIEVDVKHNETSHFTGLLDSGTHPVPRRGRVRKCTDSHPASV